MERRNCEAELLQAPLQFAILSRGRGRQAMHLPCKQADVGALPTDSTTFTAGNSTNAQREAS